MFRIIKKIILICIIGFLIINCDRIFPDISTKEMKPGIEKALATGFNSSKHFIGGRASKSWKKAKPKLKKYGEKTLKNTEKVLDEESKD